jgi:tetratricopeptide (TPR) repeat protein
MQRFGKYGEAVPIFQQALAMKGEGALSETERALTLYRLADSLYGQKNYSAAAKYYKEAMAIYEKSSSQPSISVANCLCQLANIYLIQNDPSRAEPLIRRALAIDEKCAVANSFVTGRSAGILGLLYYNQGKFDQALPLYQRAFAIYEKQAPELANSPAVARTAYQLANIYCARKNYTEAEPLYKLAIKLYSRSEIDPHRYLGVYRSFETMLRSTNRGAEADAIARQANVLKTVRKGKMDEPLEGTY